MDSYTLMVLSTSSCHELENVFFPAKDFIKHCIPSAPLLRPFLSALSTLLHASKRDPFTLEGP